MPSKRKKSQLEILYPDCAGIDIGKAKHYVAVDPDRFDEPVRAFESFTEDLESMVQWLLACHVRLVAMEATGVYWIPLYEVLDRAGIEVHLVNSRATKQGSGRKSDVLDCQWIRQLMSYGLLKGAFRPDDDTCILRSYVRQRDRLTKDSARAIQHMQKALTEMNVQLDLVLSDIMGQTGQRILRAIVNGERDGKVLAAHRDRRVKADEATIARALRGNWRTEHLLALTQALARYDFFQNQIDELETQITETIAAQSKQADELDLSSPSRTRKDRAMQRALQQLLGVDLTAIPTIGVETALVVASEIGPDLSRFPSCEHFCSWTTLAPDTRISGGRRLPGHTPKRVNRVGQALRVAASTARHNNSFIGAAHRARLARQDTPRAIKATANQLARLIYTLLTRGEQYIERGTEFYETQHRNKQISHLHRKARQLGFEVTEIVEKTAA